MVHSFLSQWDNDGDGCVDFKEFLMVVARMLTEDVTDNLERMREAFGLFDTVSASSNLMIIGKWHI